MLSGYRVLSRRFVKSFPALSREFEIETELTVHTMRLRVPQTEISVGFKDRPNGGESKLRTYHDGYKQVEPVMLFNLSEDPHEQVDVSAALPELTQYALSLLDEWHAEQMRTAATNVDPMMTVLREGGPFHTRGTLPAYLKHLRATGRAAYADRLERLHPEEAKG